MKIKVAAVQTRNVDFDVRGTLDRASSMVAQAAVQGAQLICLPEFLASGYRFDERAWEVAEAPDGPTVQWLCGLASRHEVLVGTSFLETDGEHFRNAFVLAGPAGVLGKVYKQEVSYYENFNTLEEPGSHVIDTPLGKIGVGICYENTRAYLSRDLVEGDADLLLQPHCSPGLSPWLPRPIREILERTNRALPSLYAEGLGIPTLYVNKCGSLDTPRPTFPWGRYKAPFLGNSAICDGGGQELARLDREEGIALAEVSLDPSRKTHTALTPQGNWVIKVPRIALAYMEHIARRGQAAYANNPRRASAAASRLTGG